MKACSSNCSYNIHPNVPSMAGHCVLTLGTGGHVDKGGLPMTLLPAHCYAVIGEKIGFIHVD